MELKLKISSINATKIDLRTNDGKIIVDGNTIENEKILIYLASRKTS